MKTWHLVTVAGGLLISTSPQLGSVARAASAPQPVCHDASDYLVITRERDGEPGTDFIVRRKASLALKAGPVIEGPCLYVVRPGDYVLGKGENADFVAMKHRFLALDAGTGPDRRLLIFDVAARRKLVDVPYVDGDILGANPNGFTYRQVSAASVKPSVCPTKWRQANGTATLAHTTREMLFRFSDGMARATGKSGCTQTQGDM